MITLYIKTHNKTGLKYFGRTINEDYNSYVGSGTRWRHHIKIHGYDVTTEVYKQYDDICFGLVRDALRFSRNNNIVKDNGWANLKEENGLAYGGKNVQFSDERRENHRKSQLGLSTGLAVYVDENGNNVKISVKEANARGLVAQSKGRKYSDEVNAKKATKGEKNAMFNKKHTPEAKIKQGIKSKGTITCFDLEEKIMKRISKELFYEFRNVKYVGPTSIYAKEYYENKEN